MMLKTDDDDVSHYIYLYFPIQKKTWDIFP